MHKPTDLSRCEALCGVGIEAGAAAPVERGIEIAPHIGGAFGEPLGDFAEQEVMGGEIRRDPRSALAQEVSIEDVHGSGHEIYMAWPRPRAKRGRCDCAQT